MNSWSELKNLPSPQTIRKRPATSEGTQQAQALKLQNNQTAMMMRAPRAAVQQGVAQRARRMSAHNVR